MFEYGRSFLYHVDSCFSGGWLVVFQSISIFVGYLMLNVIYLYDLQGIASSYVWLFSFMAYQYLWVI